MAGGGVASGSGVGAGGGGGKAAVKVARKVRTQAQSKTNCLVCRLTTNIIPSNRAGVSSVESATPGFILIVPNSLLRCLG
jgi:hypothetical protein